MSQSKLFLLFSISIIFFNAFNLTSSKVHISHCNLSLRESVSWKHDEVGNFKIRGEIINYITNRARELLS